MAFSRVHNFVTAIADSGDATLLQPSNWNEAHNVSGAAVGGIPYCPTATTETTEAGFTWKAATGQGLLLQVGTATTDVNALSITQTMNAAAVAFTGSKWTFTEGASGTAAGTLLFDILYGTIGAEASKFSVSKAGVVSGASSTTGPTYAFNANTNYGLGLNTGRWGIEIWTSGGLTVGIPTGGVYVNVDGVFSWNSAALSTGVAADTGLSRISAGLIGVGTGAAGSFAGSLKLLNITATGNIALAAGTTALSPLTSTSGTNLTTPVAGAHEYDGSVFYKTPVASNRAVDDIEHFITQTANRTLTDQAALQACFDAVTNGTITLPAATGYYFEWLVLGTNTGATSHQWQLGFGGTATLTSISYASYGSTATSAGGLTNVAGGHATAATAYSVTTASTSTTENVRIRATGRIYINAAGTLIPQIGFSAQPNGTETLLAGSFFRMWPIGSNSVASVGNWS